MAVGGVIGVSGEVTPTAAATEAGTWASEVITEVGAGRDRLDVRGAVGLVVMVADHDEGAHQNDGDDDEPQGDITAGNRVHDGRFRRLGGIQAHGRHQRRPGVWPFWGRSARGR